MTQQHAGDRHPVARFSFFPSLLLLLGLIALAGGGCASNNSPQAHFGEYKKMLERQKAGMPLEDDALKKLPAMTPADYERLGDTYLQQGDMDMAFIQYDKALRMEPGQARIRYKMGLLFLKKGLPEEATKEFQEILKSDVTYALAYEGMGQALLKTAKYGEAETNFRQALASSPELWQCHNFLGIIYDRQKRFDAAIAEYRAALAMKPDYGFLFNNLGMSYYFKGDYERAIQAYTEALKTAPSQQKIYNNLGIALAKLGRYEEALEAFKKAGDEGKAYNNLGVAYFGEKRYQDAIAAFEKAIHLSPSYYLKASENLKVARQALSQSASVSATTTRVPEPPFRPDPIVDKGQSDSEQQPPNAQPMTIDRRSQLENILPATEAILSIQITDASGSYTIQVHSFRTKAKVDRVVSHYQQQGYQAFSAPQRGSEEEPRWRRIFIGRFATKTDAEAFGRQVSLRERLTNFLVVRGSWAGA